MVYSYIAVHCYFWEPHTALHYSLGSQLNQLTLLWGINTQLT
jgi:hypothetical protein